MHSFILMMLLAAASTSVSAEWIVVGNSGIASDINSFNVYGDPATIRRSGDIVKMWFMFDFKSPQVEEGHRYLSQMILGEFDCKEELIRAIYMKMHAGNLGLGQVVHTNSKSRKWVPVSPGSVNEGEWKLACTNA
jgi:hypothetical protein